MAFDATLDVETGLLFSDVAKGTASVVCLTKANGIELHSETEVLTLTAAERASLQAIVDRARAAAEARLKPALQKTAAPAPTGGK